MTLIHSKNPSEKKRCEFCFKITLVSMVPIRVIIKKKKLRLAYAGCAPGVRPVCTRLGADGYLRFSLVS